MNPLATRVELRPRGPLEVLDLACAVVREARGAVGRLTAALAAGGGALWAAAAWAGEPEAGLLLLVLLVPFLHVPYTLLGARVLFDLQARAGAVVGDMWEQRAALAAFAGLVCVIPMVTVASLFTLSPLLVALVFVPETLLLERAGVAQAVRRSAQLAGAAAGRVAVGAVVGVTLSGWGAFAGEVVGQAVVRDVLMLGQPFGAGWQGDVTPYAVAGLLLSQPLVAVFRLMLYVDVRTVTEGWDLQVALRAAAGGEA